MDNYQGMESYEPSADELINVLKNLENLAAASPALYRAIVDQINGKLTIFFSLKKVAKTFTTTADFEYVLLLSKSFPFFFVSDSQQSQGTKSYW